MKKELGKSMIIIAQLSRNLHSIVLEKYRQRTRFLRIYLTAIIDSFTNYIEDC